MRDDRREKNQEFRSHRVAGSRRGLVRHSRLLITFIDLRTLELAGGVQNRWTPTPQAHAMGHVPESPLGGHRGMDFFTVEVMTLTGPVRYSVLVVMDFEDTPG